MRYNKTQIIRDTSGTRFKETTIVPKIKVTGDDQYVEVSVTDRLDLLSNDYYGTPEYWWIIAAANGLGKGTLAIQEGSILRLPANPRAIAGGLTGY